MPRPKKQPVWKTMSRRDALGTLGALGAALLGGCGGGAAIAQDLASPGDLARPTDLDSLSCIVTPAETEGPFFVDEMLNRSDLTTGTSEPFVTGGIPLVLRLAIYRVAGSTCTPFPNAQVDVWHTNAGGIYSDEASGAIQSQNTVGEKYLRGYQVTDASGVVEFKTIYPGWYPGRTIHFHFKVRTFTAGEKSYEFTSQLYIDDAMNDVIMSQPPYNTRGPRSVRNPDDGIYAENGDQLLLDVVPNDAGYLGTFTLGLQTA